METRDVISDFRRRYEGTYVWLKQSEQNTETLVHVDSVSDSDSKMAVLSLTCQTLGQLQINFGSSEYSLRFRYPPVGVFQHADQPFMFMRKPARQYRRGLCGDNSTMVNVSRWMTGGYATWSPAEVASAFRHDVFAYRVAIARLQVEKKLRGVALADEYSLIRTPIGDTKDHILMHWQNPVARINPETGTMTVCLEAVYEREIQDIIGGLA